MANQFSYPSKHDIVNSADGVDPVSIPTRCCDSLANQANLSSPGGKPGYSSGENMSRFGMSEVASGDEIKVRKTAKSLRRGLIPIVVAAPAVLVPVLVGVGIYWA